MRLKDQVALVTGASRGIGKAIALAFAKEGADVVVNYLSSGKEASDVVKEIKVMGRRAIEIKADVSRCEEVNEMVRGILAEFNKIDILVNNAGTTRRVDLLDATQEDWDIVMNTNLKSMFNCTQAVARHMVDRKYGKIINMTSIAGLGLASNKNMIYSVSKGAVFVFTKKVAVELGRYGINVNGIAPGFTVTDFFRHNGMGEEEFISVVEKRKKTSMLGMVITPQDIADTAVFLSSQESHLITGQVIVVDTGRIDYLSHSA